jgi:hypothetical protein
LQLLRVLPCPEERGEQKPDEDGDNRDDDEELDQGEPSAARGERERGSGHRHLQGFERELGGSRERWRPWESKILRDILGQSEENP